MKVPLYINTLEGLSVWEETKKPDTIGVPKQAQLREIAEFNPRVGRSLAGRVLDDCLALLFGSKYEKRDYSAWSIYKGIPIKYLNN